MLSQDELNALLSGVNAGSSDPQPDPQPAATEEILTDIEKDAIGEIANISMGTSATTLNSLVNRKVNITTPTVSIANWKNFIDEQEKPCVFIQIKYTEGLDGANILIMRERDVKVITDLMMGGDGSNIDGELGELHLSAISEAMNQMMGSSATSLSSMLGRMIDISPPEASLVNILENKNGADIAPFLAGDFVKIEFRMQIEDLVDSTIMQLYPIDFAKSLYKIFMDQQMGTSAAPAQPDPAPQPQSVPAPQPLPERLVYCKIELGTGRGAGISVFIACARGSGNVLRQVPHQRGCLLATADFLGDAVLPTIAQLVQQNSLKSQTITERIIHEKVFVPVLHR